MFDTTFLIALAAAILSAASIVLHVVAPRTKTTIDDALRDDIDEVLAFIRGPQAKSGTSATTITKGPGAVLVLLAIGLAATQPACATVRSHGAAGLEALIDCTTPQRAPVVADLGVALEGYLLRYVSGDGRTVDLAKLKADAGQLKGEVLGSCGLVAALAALAKPPAESVRSLLAPAGPDPAAWAAALAEVRAELGVGAVKAAGS